MIFWMLQHRQLMHRMSVRRGVHQAVVLHVTIQRGELLQGIVRYFVSGILSHMVHAN